MYPSPHVRVSDSDREAVVARLSTATAEGRLTIEEFSERSRSAYAARTWGELSRVLYDLPGDELVATPAAAAAGSRLPLLALIAGALPLPLALCAQVVLPAPICAVTAVVLGIMALRGPADTVRHGRRMAIGGIALGGLGVLAIVTGIAQFLFGGSLDA
ncbi:hypothetical protein ACWT_1956 [Actinoplanes sp. SE50]|uniref:DUF1707 SHOCT-like domain-containing protein n=1 Tax=unclassified Actinoplanes TaxID=2626549 RepID=UPI00023EC07D|nr:MULTISPECIES: DUF1707 domain-containing protein [unclassified Actinoplanes]AEV82975.1 uncharacterized protein ACPL_2078 [Actinoplanes sp. SE50/110]ATO81371.1 hypothetical protein ACWT_1956 [Actinoplanes sp. SE50]SLL98778.1 uncharacterized protein ACSP50_2005 [Actinoplanes sp. SE50/110]